MNLKDKFWNKTNYYNSWLSNDQTYCAQKLTKFSPQVVYRMKLYQKLIKKLHCKKVLKADRQRK